MKKRFLTLLFALVAMCLIFVLVGCEQNGEGETLPDTDHVHTFSAKWSSDDTYHWHAATCEHKSETSGKAAHTYSGDTCSVCGHKKKSEPVADSTYYMYGDNSQKLESVYVKISGDTCTVSDGENIVTGTKKKDGKLEYYSFVMDDRQCKAVVTGTGVVKLYIGDNEVGVFYMDGYAPKPEQPSGCDHRNYRIIQQPEYLASAGDCKSPATYYPVCKKCGDVLRDRPQKVDSYGPHKFVEVATSKYLVSAANCTDKAVYHKSCSVCGAADTATFTYGETNDDHDFTRAEPAQEYFAEAASCTQLGSYYYSCTRCHAAGTETFTGGDYAHEYDADGVCGKCGEHKLTEGLYFSWIQGSGSVSVIGFYNAHPTDVWITDTVYISGMHYTVTEVYIPENDFVQTIHIPAGAGVGRGSYGALGGFTALREITVAEGNAHYKAIDGNLYNGDGTKLYRVAPASGATVYEMPDSVTEIDRYAFYGCNALAAINAGEQNTAFASADGILYNKQYTEIKVVPAALAGSVDIASGVTNIPARAFEGRVGLTRIGIPSTVAYVDEDAFDGCTGLNGVDITDVASWCGINFISLASNPLTAAEDLYLNGSLVTELTIPSTVTSIGRYVFNNCSGLTRINYNVPECNYNRFYNAFAGTGSKSDGITLCVGANVRTIPSELFSDANIVDIVFEEGTVCTDIGSKAFYGCHIKHACVPAAVLSSIDKDELETLEVIGSGAIKYSAMCSAPVLKRVTIGDNVTEISSRAFEDCKMLVSVTLGDKVTSIGSAAFNNCEKLMSVTLGEKVTNIGSSAFNNCGKLVEIYNLSELTLTAGSNDNGYIAKRALDIYDDIDTPSKLRTAGDYVLYDGVDRRYLIAYYGSDTALTLPDNISGGAYAIFETAFYKNTTVTSVIIPDAVTAIGERAFAGCMALESVVIPDAVTAIGERAFAGCTALESVTVGAGGMTVGSSAFYNCTSISRVNIADVGDWTRISFLSEGSNPAYNGATIYVSGEPLTEVVVPDDVTVISGYAFYGCKTLTSITMGDNVSEIGTSAFCDCDSLETVVIGKNVTRIAASSFEGCNALVDMTLPFTGESIYSSGSSGLFGDIFGRAPDFEQNTEQSYEYSSYQNSSQVYTATFSIPLTLRRITINGNKIKSGAFSGCSMIEEITIGENVTEIGNYAFYKCTGLTKINYNAKNCADTSGGFNMGSWKNNNIFLNAGMDGDGIVLTIDAAVRKIPAYIFSPTAYETNVNMKSIIFGAESQCSSIGSDAFGCVYSVDSLYYNDPVAKWITVTNIGHLAPRTQNVYFNNEPLTELVIPSGITSIGSHTFYKFKSLRRVTIGADVTSIGEEAFYECIHLYEVCNLSSSLDIVKGDTSHGYVGFYAVGFLASASAPSRISVTSDGFTVYDVGDDTYLLLNYTGDEKNIVLPDNINGKSYAINSYAFYESDITGIVIPNGVTGIGRYAFGNCQSLTGEIKIPGTVSVIGQGAFSFCASITTLVMEDGVTEIGAYAFEYCRSLQYAIVSATLNTVGTWAFYGCDNLKSAYYRTTEWYVVSLNGSARNYRYSETKPEDPGWLAWHYDTDGVTPVIW